MIFPGDGEIGSDTWASVSSVPPGSRPFVFTEYSCQWTGGRVGNEFSADVPVMVMSHSGRRSEATLQKLFSRRTKQAGIAAD
ncbi:hypothetical protein FA95DRAFT_1560674 [Auriscalpium vulgare]|uniref:Uncharacterized protein n=1 Tax=Auriscalpium vulgare TaxID=40419 RepID=A0ACB8RPM9_9AGAM|nr:hypothetical protein FA95DRAFT_1560674 [Auriscalpium vulgare]